MLYVVRKDLRHDKITCSLVMEYQKLDGNVFGNIFRALPDALAPYECQAKDLQCDEILLPLFFKTGMVYNKLVSNM